eukprot:snap_masked-scaffold634_size121673-processed-gene-0.11 protein:Tk06607 transcript:snap_masked-scaffold634_size121673-processed-gene-0.11-mRNA-1 annotation:"sodium calcium exchanger 2-like"
MNALTTTTTKCLCQVQKVVSTQGPHPSSFLGFEIIPGTNSFLLLVIVRGSVFVVQSGSLAFSVTIYSICAILGIGVLIGRRLIPGFGNAELGGPTGTKWASGMFLVFMWIMYVALSTLQAYGVIPGI